MEKQNELLINRLAHFVPNSVDDKKQTKQDFILSGIYYANKPSITISELEEAISNNLGVKITKNEIEGILDILIDNNSILKLNNKFMLSPEKQEEMKKSIEMEKQNEDKVINIWLYNEIRPNNPFLSNNDLKIIKNDLILFLKALFIRHGLESLSLIMNDRDNLTVDGLNMKSVIDSLPSQDEKIKSIEYNEFPNFFSGADNDRVNYLVHFLDKAFKFLTAVCDPEVMENFKEKIRGKKIYLDSSVVYRLENLQGEDRHKVTREVVEMCQNYDLDLRVNAKTLEELKGRLSYDAKLLKDYPVRTELAKIGYKNINQKNYVTTYWKENSEKGTSLKDFINYYKHIDDLLIEDGINVEKNYPELPKDFDKKVINFISMFRKRDPEGKIKKDYSAEHDAYNLALIDFYRDDEGSSFIDTNAWFLTTDHFIINLQKTDHELKNHVPLAILPSQLIQILRFITPVDDSFDEAFINLFSNSLRTSGTMISTKTAQEILSRIGRYKGSPALAKKILLDSYFIHQFEKCESDGEKEEMIYDSLISKAEEMKTELEQVNEKINSVETAKEELTYDLEEEVKKNRMLIDNFANQKNEIKESKKQMAAYNKLIDIQNRIISFIVIFILGTTIIFVLIKYFGWNWDNFSPIIEKLLMGLLYIILPSAAGLLLNPFVKRNVTDKLINNMFKIPNSSEEE